MKRPAVATAAFCLFAVFSISTTILAGAVLAATPKENKAVQAADSKVPAVMDSLGLLEKAVARDSSKFDNLYRLGVMLMDRDRSQDAIRVFTKAVTLRPADSKALVNLGAAYDALGSGDPAQAYYRAALKAAPGDSVASCRLAQSLYATNKTGDAMDMLRQIIHDKPSAYCAYFTLGVAFADAGLYGDAVRMWKKVIALSPQSPEAISASESIEVLERYVKSQ